MYHWRVQSAIFLEKVFYYDIILPEEEYSFNTEERQLWFVVGCCQCDSTDDSFLMRCSNFKALSEIFKALKAALLTLFKPVIAQAPAVREWADWLKVMYAPINH